MSHIPIIKSAEKSDLGGLYAHRKKYKRPLPLPSRPSSKTFNLLPTQSPTESLCTSPNQNISEAMPSGISQRARAILKQSCPDLALGVNSTTSSAMHDSTFVGTLRQWMNF
jgi:hypothetical protein